MIIKYKFMEINKNEIKWGRTIEKGEKELQPSTLDVVKIDGRLAQVVVGTKEITILYLENKQREYITLDDYKLTKHYDTSLGDLLISKELEISETELDNIHYDVRSKNNREMKKQITVFGEYEKK